MDSKYLLYTDAQRRGVLNTLKEKTNIFQKGRERGSELIGEQMALLRTFDDEIRKISLNHGKYKSSLKNDIQKAEKSFTLGIWLDVDYWLTNFYDTLKVISDKSIVFHKQIKSKNQEVKQFFGRTVESAFKSEDLINKFYDVFPSISPRAMSARQLEKIYESIIGESKELVSLAIEEAKIAFASIKALFDQLDNLRSSGDFIEYADLVIEFVDIYQKNYNNFLKVKKRVFNSLRKAKQQGADIPSTEGSEAKTTNKPEENKQSEEDQESSEKETNPSVSSKSRPEANSDSEPSSSSSSSSSSNPQSESKESKESKPSSSSPFEFNLTKLLKSGPKSESKTEPTSKSEAPGPTKVNIQYDDLIYPKPSFLSRFKKYLENKNSPKASFQSEPELTPEPELDPSEEERINKELEDIKKREKEEREREAEMIEQQIAKMKAQVENENKKKSKKKAFNFLQELKKVSEITNNKYLMASMIAKYSESLEDTDPEASAELLRIADGIINE